jgi:ElaA protein
VSSMPNVTLEWQRFEQFSAPALYQLLGFRQAIFVVEQRSPYPDLDGLDQGAWHLLLREGGELAGCLRLAPLPLLRIGRVAVASRLRRQGLGRRLIDAAMSFCRDRYPGQPVRLAAQLPLARFYQRFGFSPVSQPYDDFGVMHVEMSVAAE